MDKLKLAVLGFLALVSIYILTPFFDAIFFGLITAYALKILVKRLGKKLNKKFVGIVLSIIIVGIVFGGLYFIVTHASLVTLEIITLSERASEAVEAFLITYELEALSEYVSQGFIILEGNIRDLIFRVVSQAHLMLLNALIFFIVLFFSYRDGEKVYDIFMSILEKLDKEDREFITKIIEYVEQLIKDVFVIYGTYSIITMAIAAIGFYLLGMIFLGHPLPFFWLWAIGAGLAAFFRGFTSAVFLIPIIFYYFVMGETLFAFLLTIFGIFFLAIIPEAFILPYLGASKIDESYLIFLLGFMSGVLVFGVKGLILGPIILITFKHIVQEQLGLI